jgi:hypothetical protein
MPTLPRLSLPGADRLVAVSSDLLVHTLGMFVHASPNNVIDVLYCLLDELRYLVGCISCIRLLLVAVAWWRWVCRRRKRAKAVRKEAGL